MANITSYNTLKEAVISAAEDNSTEFSNYFDTALGISEEFLLDAVDIEELKQITTLTAVSGDKLLDKPEDYLVPFDAIIASDLSMVEDRVLQFTTNDYITMYWPNEETLGTPVYYADYDEDSFVLAPTPQVAFEIELAYLAKPTPLSLSNQTNILTDKVPSALFIKMMVEMCKFQKAWNEARAWQEELDLVLTTNNNRGRRQRRDDSTQKPKTYSAQNTVTGE